MEMVGAIVLCQLIAFTIQSELTILNAVCIPTGDTTEIRTFSIYSSTVLKPRESVGEISVAIRD